MTLICQSHYVLDKDYKVFNIYCLGDTCGKKLLTNFMGWIWGIIQHLRHEWFKNPSVLAWSSLTWPLCLVLGFLTSVDCLCDILMGRSLHHFISCIIRNKFKMRFNDSHLNTPWERFRCNLNIYTLGIYLNI